MVGLDLSYMILLYWSMLLLCPIRVFFFFFKIMNGCLILSNGFLLHLLKWLWALYIHFYYCDVLHSLIVMYWTILATKMSLTWLWYMTLSICCWNHFLSWEYLHLYSSEIFLILFWSAHIWFWHKSNAGLMKWVWNYSHLFNFLHEFEKDWY